jgi:hypothetical protein
MGAGLLPLLRRYTDPATCSLGGRGWQLRATVWALDLRDGWVTAATDGHLLVAVPGTHTGARLLQGQKPEVMDWLRHYLAPPSPTHTAWREALRAWAGSPEWPPVWPWECPECRGRGELDCDAFEHLDFPPCGDGCPHAEWCCEGRYTCDRCSREGDPLLGELLGAIVNRRNVARVLDMPFGSAIALRCDGPEAPLFLTDGRLRAVVMPMRRDEDDEAAPVFSEARAVPLPLRGAP